MPASARSSVRSVDRARLLLVDDHDLARAGFRSMLRREKEVEIVGEARDARTAISMCGRLHPDAVLMDVRMPDMDGLAAARIIRERFPQIKVIIVTMFENPDYLREAIQAEAAGFILKGASQQEVLRSLRQALEGQTLADSGVARGLVAKMSAQSASWQLVSRLTARESEVLRLLCRGWSNPQIGAALGITAGTAKSRVERILRKLEVSDRTEAASRAASLGLIAPNEL